MLGSSTDNLTPSDLKMMDRFLDEELQARKQNLERQVRDFVGFALVVKEWRKSVAGSVVEF